MKPYERCDNYDRKHSRKHPGHRGTRVVNSECLVCVEHGPIDALLDSERPRPMEVLEACSTYVVTATHETAYETAVRIAETQAEGSSERFHDAATAVVSHAVKSGSNAPGRLTAEQYTSGKH